MSFGESSFNPDHFSIDPIGNGLWTVAMSCTDGTWVRVFDGSWPACFHWIDTIEDDLLVAA